MTVPKLCPQKPHAVVLTVRTGKDTQVKCSGNTGKSERIGLRKTAKKMLGAFCFTGEKFSLRKGVFPGRGGA